MHPTLAGLIEATLASRVPDSRSPHTHIFRFS